MDREEILETVNKIMIEEFEIEASLLLPEALLGDGIGLDSLDAVDLVVSLEKKFALRIPEDKARAMTTLGNVYDYIESQLQEQ